MNGFLSNINSLHKNIKTRLISDFFISIVFMGIGPFFTIYLVEGIGVKNASYILFASIVLRVVVPPYDFTPKIYKFSPLKTPFKIQK